jgi:hypothetical protein
VEDHRDNRTIHNHGSEMAAIVEPQFGEQCDGTPGRNSMCQFGSAK